MSIHLLCPTGKKFHSLVDDGFSIGFAFAACLPEALSSSWTGIASLTYFSTPFEILIQDMVWSSNNDGTSTSIHYLPIDLQTFMSETGPNFAML